MGIVRSRMNRLTAGLARRFLVFCRDVLSEMPTVSPSARNQTSDSCGRPSGPIVPRVATWASSRSRCDAGIAGMVLLIPLPALRPGLPGHGGTQPARLPGLVGQCLVDELAQLRAQPVRAGGEQLGEERDGQLRVLVDPEGGARRTAPGELTVGAGHPAGRRVDDDGKTQ